MPKTGLAFAALRKMMLAWPGVEESTSYGTPSFKLKGKFMARLRDDDRDVLVLTPVEDDEQQFLMATQPQAFFLTDHYRVYPTILIRLSQVDPAQLRDLLAQAWCRRAPKKLLAEHDAVTASAKPARRTASKSRSRS